MPSSKSLRALSAAAVIAGAIMSAACNPGGTEPVATPKVHSVSFATHTALDTSCQRLSLTPTVSADTGAITAVLWSSSDSTIVLPDSVGHLLALAPGTATIKAKAFLDNTLFDTVRVSVVDPPGPFVSILGVQQAATGTPANLTAVHDSIDVALQVTAPGCRKTNAPKWVHADVSIANGSNSLSRTYSYPTGIGGTLLLRLNTVATDSVTGIPKLPNGNYAITASVTRSDSVVSRAPSAIQVTVANQ